MWKKCVGQLGIINVGQLSRNKMIKSVCVKA
jgi:hypothetical protein